MKFVGFGKVSFDTKLFAVFGLRRLAGGPKACKLAAFWRLTLLNHRICSVSTLSAYNVAPLSFLHLTKSTLTLRYLCLCHMISFSYLFWAVSLHYIVFFGPKLIDLLVPQAHRLFRALS